METTVWTYVLQVALVVVAFAAGGPVAYRLVDAIKEQFALSGWKANAVAFVVSIVLAAAGLVVEGVIRPDAFAPDNIAALVIAVYAASQLHYQKMKQEDTLATARAALQQVGDAEG